MTYGWLGHLSSWSLWRNRLARSAVNRKVGGSSPLRDEEFVIFSSHYLTFGVAQCRYALAEHLSPAIVSLDWQHAIGLAQQILYTSRVQPATSCNFLGAHRCKCKCSTSGNYGPKPAPHRTSDCTVWEYINTISTADQ